MATVSAQGAGSGLGKGSQRRSLDAEINLVPFIDLLSMCICFLLMTAVWIQIGAMQVKQTHGTEAAAPQSGAYEMDLRFSGPTALQIQLKRGGRIVKKLELGERSAETLAAKLDESLAGILAAPKGSLVNVESATVTPREGVSYGSLVAVMDQLRKHQIVNLGVIPVSARGN